MDKKFQKLTCIDSSDLYRIKKDEIYYGIESEHYYTIYSQPEEKTGKSSNKIGIYAKSKFIDKAKWRDEQIDSVIKEDMTVEDCLKQEETKIVDVRTYEEFQGGHVAGSINIPLNELHDNLDYLKEIKYIVLCCASGNRSKTAQSLLKLQNIITTDGGSWLNVNRIKATLN